MGKTLSGKTYLTEKLQNEFNVPRIITSTTRPIRENEQNGVDYHFVTAKRFHEAIKNDRALAVRKYHVIHDQIWSYYLDKADLERLIHNKKNGIFILDLKGYLDLERELKQDSKLASTIKLQGLYLDIPLKTRIMRHFDTQRQTDNDQEFVRRLADDELNAFTKLNNCATNKDAQQFARKHHIKVFNENYNIYDVLDYLYVNDYRKYGDQ